MLLRSRTAPHGRSVEVGASPLRERLLTAVQPRAKLMGLRFILSQAALHARKETGTVTALRESGLGKADSS